MKTVGLLSGGKDSCFNLCHCVAQGHEIVALASLHPQGGKAISIMHHVTRSYPCFPTLLNVEEIDSYMYQTVGQDGIHYIAEAMELPLFRRTIDGSAVDQSSDYASTSAARLVGHVKGDETEDLLMLLQDVLAAFPDVKAVSVGAILSNYQRVRVEHVCARLGLQALSYLWQFDQSQLLEDMDAAGLESVIIKVAGAGLGVRHLNKNVCGQEMRDTLQKLNQKWGTHPAGEGGEYETFTIDCPLFKKRINLLETEPVVLSSGSSRDDIGTVAYIRLKKAELVDKSTTWSMSDEVNKVHIPSVLDEESEDMLRHLQTKGKAAQLDPSSAQAIPRLSRPGWFTSEEFTSPSGQLEEEVKGCFKRLSDFLEQHGLEFTHLIHINLQISSMTLFPAVNAVYNTFFGPVPPTRACVAVALPDGVRVGLQGIAYKASNQSERRIALHVRGMSYWAPANIGPYSQAVLVDERLYIAGQIALQPATLTLPLPPSFETEVVLALQHVRRIVKAVQEGPNGNFTGFPESCICWLAGSESELEERKKTAYYAWKLFNEHAGVPFEFRYATELPRGAMVEWQIVWSTGRTPEVDSDDEEP